MEDDPPIHHRRTKRRDALCHCTATLRSDNRRAPVPLRVLLAGMAFSSLVFGTLYIIWLGVGHVDETPCFVLIPLICGLLGWYLFSHFVQPSRRGRMLLFPDRLVFRWFLADREKPILLRDIRRIGRRRNRIHVGLTDDQHCFFSCSRLHGEDMYDQILARLEELGLEVINHERQR